MPTVTTTMQPDRPIEVDDHEARNLRDQGLLTAESVQALADAEEAEARAVIADAVEAAKPTQPKTTVKEG